MAADNTHTNSTVNDDQLALTSTEQWQHCVENTLRKTVIGLAVSSAAFLLFSGTKTRLMSLAFGAGTGFGMGYSECRLSFEKNVHLSRKTIALVDILPANKKQGTSQVTKDE